MIMYVRNAVAVFQCSCIQKNCHGIADERLLLKNGMQRSDQTENPLNYKGYKKKLKNFRKRQDLMKQS